MVQYVSDNVGEKTYDVYSVTYAVKTNIYISKIISNNRVSCKPFFNFVYRLIIFKG